MKTELQKKLEHQIEAQMGIENKQILQQWQNNSYMMDQNIALQFWDEIEKAPAVYIVGDYDCDGVCASYIMSKAIRHRYPQKPIRVRIPHRLTEGYGMNRNIYTELKEKVPKGSAIVTVDNGIACADLLEEIKADGYKVLLTDHHELGNNRLPQVDMVLNPKVPINGVNYFDGDYWCGAAVAYKLAENFVSEDLKNDLECFAGLATIGDVMPLKEGNWGLVRRVMDNIKQGNAPQSILNLLKALKQDPTNLQETSISFYIVPAINAPGRLLDDGASKYSLSYLLKPTEEKCAALVELNNQRKQLRDQQVEEVRQIIYEQGMENDCPIWVAAPGLHEGIVGIIAGRIAEEFGVPTIILTESEKDPTIYKGSARTAGDINIFEHLCSMSDLFVGFGGHKEAAGLSIPKENLAMARSIQIDKPTIMTSGIKMNILPTDITDIAETCEIYRPFGQGNPQPEFSVDINLKKVNEKSIRMLGNPAVHLCINDPIKKYKMMHFYHMPNNLKNPNEFRLTGEIHYETFQNVVSSVLVANDMEDYEQDEKDKEIEMD